MTISGRGVRGVSSRVSKPNLMSRPSGNPEHWNVSTTTYLAFEQYIHEGVFKTTPTRGGVVSQMSTNIYEVLTYIEMAHKLCLLIQV